MASEAWAMPTTVHSPRVAEGARSASEGWLRTKCGVDVGVGEGAGGDAGAAQLANVRRQAQAPIVERRNLATDSCPKPVWIGCGPSPYTTSRHKPELLTSARKVSLQ